MNIFLLALTLVGFFVVWLLMFQHRMIYYPRRYSPAELSEGTRLEQLQFTTSEGQQTAFLRPPSGGGPAVIWVMFAGNASVALDWRFFIQEFPDRDAGFLLVDYPGYGLNEGSASPDSIAETAEGAMRAVASQLGKDKQFEVNLLGNSLGAAAAVAFAAAHTEDEYAPKRLLLVAPFTSLGDMAKRAVGPLFAKLLRHNFDNTARLRTVLAAPNVPEIYIFHGTMDEVVPFEMGRELASLDPKRIKFREYRGEQHNSLLHGAQEDIYAAMTDSLRDESD